MQLFSSSQSWSVIFFYYFYCQKGCCKFNKMLLNPRVNEILPGGVGRRHMVLKCLGVVLQRSAEVDKGFPAEDPLEFWDDG